MFKASLAFLLLLGVIQTGWTQKNDDSFDFDLTLLAGRDSAAIAKRLGSLAKKIDASEKLPLEHLKKTTLIVQIHDYVSYVTARGSIISLPPDSMKMRRDYAKYHKRKEYAFKKEPGFKVIYARVDELNKLDKDEFRYVFKSTTRVNFDPASLRETIASRQAYAYAVDFVYYIYDRKTGEVFSDVDGFALTSNGK